MYNKGLEIGLSKDSCNEFMGCCYEIKVNIEVYKDGTYKILGVEG
jgi:hypothetical protein